MNWRHGVFFRALMWDRQSSDADEPSLCETAALKPAVPPTHEKAIPEKRNAMVTGRAPVAYVIDGAIRAVKTVTPGLTAIQPGLVPGSPNTACFTPGGLTVTPPGQRIPVGTRAAARVIRAARAARHPCENWDYPQVGCLKCRTDI